MFVVVVVLIVVDVVRKRERERESKRRGAREWSSYVKETSCSW